MNGWDTRAKKIAKLAKERSLKTTGFRKAMYDIIKTLYPKIEYNKIPYNEWIDQWIEDGQSKPTYEEYIDYHFENQFRDCNVVPPAFKITFRNDGCYGIHVYEIKGTGKLSRDRIAWYINCADVQHIDIRLTLHIIDKYNHETIIDNEVLCNLLIIEMRDELLKNDILLEAIDGLILGIDIDNILIESRQDYQKCNVVEEEKPQQRLDGRCCKSCGKPLPNKKRSYCSQKCSARYRRSDRVVARAVRELGLTD